MLVPYSTVRGPARSISRVLAEALRSMGCEVVCEPWGRHLDKDSVVSRIIGRASDVRRLRRRLQVQTFDVMIVHTAHDWAALARDLSLLLGTRSLRPATVLHLHGSTPDRLLARGRSPFKMASAWLVQLCDAVVVLSSMEARVWRTFYPRGTFYIVKNPFDSSIQVSPTTCAPAWLPPPGRQVVLFVGRLIREKGVHELLQAVGQLTDINYHLLMVGDGVEAPVLRARCSAFGLTDRITFTGYLQGPDLSLAYHSADVFVCPSWREGFPTVISEAMHAGLPIITTRNGGMQDHLVDRQHALFVPPQEPRALARALRILLNDETLRRDMSTHNRSKLQDFAPGVVAAEYMQVLKEVARHV
jgi:glycosyltransferase involved in cell wall biosynthesis